MVVTQLSKPNNEIRFILTVKLSHYLPIGLEKIRMQISEFMITLVKNRLIGPSPHSTTTGCQNMIAEWISQVGKKRHDIGIVLVDNDRADSKKPPDMTDLGGRADHQIGAVPDRLPKKRPLATDHRPDHSENVFRPQPRRNILEFPTFLPKKFLQNIFFPGEYRNLVTVFAHTANHETEEVKMSGVTKINQQLHCLFDFDFKASRRQTSASSIHA